MRECSVYVDVREDVLFDFNFIFNFLKFFFLIVVVGLIKVVVSFIGGGFCDSEFFLVGMDELICGDFFLVVDCIFFFGLLVM